MLWTNNRSLIEKANMDAGYECCSLALGEHACRVLIFTAILLCLTPSVSSPETTAAFQQGVEYVRLRLYPDAALASFKHTLAHNPDFAEVHEWLGLIARMQQKPHQALAHYQKAIARKPYVQSAYCNLAKTYRLLGDTETTTEQLKLFGQMKIYTFCFRTAETAIFWRLH